MIDIMKDGLAGQQAQVNANKLIELLAEYERLCNAHDLTFDSSDDLEVWRRGQKQLSAIMVLEALIPEADAVRIWNAAVDKKIRAELRHEYYMQELKS